MPPKPFKPENFGRYLLAEKIATGGMAEIFNAKVFGAMGFEKNLVIKRILPQFAEDAEFLRMFITEAKLVCHLEHPNIVQVHELGEIDGQYYIAMEFVNGIDARHLWRTLAKRKQRLPGLLALFIVSEFLKGLDYAHRAVGPDGQLLGVVHRDVSPSNILISYRGDVKIGDFGIALVQQESKTQAGVLKGKFGYMSPEQVAGMKVDHRSDIFAAGIVLGELLLGRRLFLGQSDFETLDKVLNVRLDVLDEHEGALPPEVVKIVRKALQRDITERYQSAQEFGESIIEFLYERRARISNETLAAFIAEHVAPYLVKTQGREVSAPSVSADSGSSLGHRSPKLPGGIVPRIQLPSGKHPVLADEPVESGEYEVPVAPPPARRGQSATPRAQAGRPPPLTPANAPTSPASPAVATGRPPPREIEDEAEIIPGIEIGDLDRRAPLPVTPLAASTTDVMPPQTGAPHHSPPQAASLLPPEAYRTERAPQLADLDLGGEQFGAIPMYEMEGEGMSLDDLSLDQPGTPQRDARPSFGIAPPPGGFAEGAGEELDLGDGDDNELYVPPALAARAEGASIFVSGPTIAAVTDEPDFVGTLATRTVAKVLFRFSVVNENGLLVLKGAEPTGEQGELINWLRTIQARAQAETDGAVGEECRTCCIHLLQGQPHLLSADRSEEALVAFLLRTAVLTNKKVEKAIYTNPHRKPVAALLAAGMLSPLQVSRHVTGFVLDAVLETFAWPTGDFSFYRGKENPSEAFPSGLDTISLVLKGVGNIPEPVLDRYFGALAGRRVFLNRTPPARIDRFNPDPQLQEMYRALGPGRSVEEMVAHGAQQGDATAAKRALYLLVECELAALG